MALGREDYSVGAITFGTPGMPVHARPDALLGIGDRKNTIWVDPMAEVVFLRAECDRLEAKIVRKDAKIKRLKQKLRQQINE